MKRNKLIMKRIAYFTGLISVLTVTGCIIPEGEGHGHERHEGREGRPEVRVVNPEVVVHPPEVIVR